MIEAKYNAIMAPQTYFRYVKKSTRYFEAPQMMRPEAVAYLAYT
jgi:hypothetical protein